MEATCVGGGYESEVMLASWAICSCINFDHSKWFAYPLRVKVTALMNLNPISNLAVQARGWQQRYQHPCWCLLRRLVAQHCVKFKGA